MKNIMKKLLELRQQKSDLIHQMRSLLTKAEDEKRSLNPDEAKQFDELRTQSDALNTEIARYEALSDEERNQVKTPASNKLNNDELRNYILTGETRSLSTGVPADGGYTVIPELNKQIMQQLADESVMRQICTIKTTRSNEYKQLVSVGGAAVVHGEEGKARGETSTPKMEEVSIKLFPIYAYPKTGHAPNN
jgi:HK97 family phage major capsid protein